MNPKKKSRRYRASVSIQALDLAISRFTISLAVSQPISPWCRPWSPRPLSPKLLPQTLALSLPVCEWKMKTVWGRRGMRSSLALSKWQFVSETQRRWSSYIRTCLISRIVLRCLVSFRAFSYCAYLHSLSFPTVYNFAMRLLL
jgi:hypothetical protein